MNGSYKILALGHKKIIMYKFLINELTNLYGQIECEI
jgi:hypothetical protein